MKDYNSAANQPREKKVIIGKKPKRFNYQEHLPGEMRTVVRSYPQESVYRSPEFDNALYGNIETLITIGFKRIYGPEGDETTFGEWVGIPIELIDELIKNIKKTKKRLKASETVRPVSVDSNDPAIRGIINADAKVTKKSAGTNP